MWKSAYVGVYQLLNWKMHGETLKFVVKVFLRVLWKKNTPKCINVKNLYHICQFVIRYIFEMYTDIHWIANFAKKKILNIIFQYEV